MYRKATNTTMALRQIRSPMPSKMSTETRLQRTFPYMLLPPNQDEMYSYSERHHWIMVITSFLSFIGLSISQVKFALAAPWLWWLLPFLVFTLFYYLTSLITSICTPDFNVDLHRAFIELWRRDRTADGCWPSVDVLLPICGEDALVLRNTWKLVLRMCETYPGK